MKWRNTHPYPQKNNFFPWNQLFFWTDSLREGAVSAEEPHARKENVQKASLQGSIDWTTRMDSVYSSRYVVEVRAMTTFLLFWETSYKYNTVYLYTTAKLCIKGLLLWRIERLSRTPKNVRILLYASFSIKFYNYDVKK